MSTAIATLSQVTTLIQGTAKISKKAQKSVATFVARGRQATTEEALLIGGFSEGTTIRTVSEIAYEIEPANREERKKLARAINVILQTTTQGRTLTTSGRVALTPIAGRPYWYLDMIRLFGSKVAANLVPVRTAASQRPRVSFSRSIPDSLKEPVRASLNNWMELGGIGTRWRAPEYVARAQKDVKDALRAVTREHTLMLQLTSAAQPIIVDMVRSTVSQMIAEGSAMAEVNGVAH